MTKAIKNNFYSNKPKKFRNSKKASPPSLAFRPSIKPSPKENKRKKLDREILNTNLLKNDQKTISKYIKTKFIRRGRNQNQNQNKVEINQGSTTLEDFLLGRWQKSY
jgi:hypothetical protein